MVDEQLIQLVKELYNVKKTTICEADYRICAAKHILNKEVKTKTNLTLIADILLDIMYEDVIDFKHIIDYIEWLVSNERKEKINDSLIKLAIDYARCKLTMVLSAVDTVIMVIRNTKLLDFDPNNAKAYNEIYELLMRLKNVSMELERYIMDENSLCSATSIRIAHILVQSMILRWGSG